LGRYGTSATSPWVSLQRTHHAYVEQHEQWQGWHRSCVSEQKAERQADTMIILRAVNSMWSLNIDVPGWRCRGHGNYLCHGRNSGGNLPSLLFAHKHQLACSMASAMLWCCVHMADLWVLALAAQQRRVLDLPLWGLPFQRHAVTCTVSQCQAAIHMHAGNLCSIIVPCRSEGTEQQGNQGYFHSSAKH